MTALRARRTAPAAIEIGLTAIESQVRAARRLTDDVGTDRALAIRSQGARFARAAWGARAPAAIGIGFVAVLLRIITASRVGVGVGSGRAVAQAGRARCRGAGAGLQASAILVAGVRVRIAAARTAIRARSTARAQILERVKGARARYCEGAPEEAQRQLRTLQNAP